MKVELWPIDKPIPYARNARKISRAAIDKVASSIKEFGCRQPIVVDPENVVVVGHTRLLAARKLALSEVPVHVASALTAAQIKAYRLMENRSHEEAEWDLELLAPELAELQGLDLSLALTGFDSEEIDRALAGLDSGTQGLTDDEAAPPAPVTPVSQSGDVWTLGKHRVLCGDATVEADARSLMAGDLAALVFTDPPYNVGYEGYTEQKLTIQNDAMSSRQFTEFLRKGLTSYRTVVKPGASIYVCHPSSWQREFKVRRDGSVKVLDFGLARTEPPSPQALRDSPTLTAGD